MSASSVKIKSKNSSFIIDPETKNDSEVIILTKSPEDYSVYEGKLVIDSPGEYEVAGVSIKGDRVEGKLSFDFFEDNQKILLLSAASIIKDKETEDYTATIVKLESKLDYEFVSQAKSEVLVIFGQEEFLPQDRSTIKKADKINLKKSEEFKGFVIYLSK